MQCKFTRLIYATHYAMHKRNAKAVRDRGGNMTWTNEFLETLIPREERERRAIIESKLNEMYGTI